MQKIRLLDVCYIPKVRDLSWGHFSDEQEAVTGQTIFYSEGAVEPFVDARTGTGRYAIVKAFIIQPFDNEGFGIEFPGSSRNQLFSQSPVVIWDLSI